jgi:hypothetical protein
VKQLVIMEYVLPGLGYEKAMQPVPDWHTGSNWQLALFTVPDVAEFAFRGRERELLTWFLWHGSFNPTPVREEHLTEYVDQIARPGALRAGIEYYAAVWKDVADNAESMKTKLTMPVLGVGGSHNAGPFVGKSWEAVADDVCGVVIPESGHWLSDENPVAVSKTLLEFFDHGSEGCGANIGSRAKQEFCGLTWIRGKHCIPNFRCGFVFDGKLAEFELTLPDPMHEFDAGDRRCGLAEILEAEHRSEPKLDGSVILFDPIIQIFEDRISH